jgi:hypothetical protein
MHVLTRTLTTRCHTIAAMPRSTRRRARARGARVSLATLFEDVAESPATGDIVPATPAAAKVAAVEAFQSLPDHPLLRRPPDGARAWAGVLKTSFLACATAVVDALNAAAGADDPAAAAFRLDVKTVSPHYSIFNAYAPDTARAARLVEALSEAVAAAAGPPPAGMVAVRPTFGEARYYLRDKPCAATAMVLDQEHVRYWYGTPHAEAPSTATMHLMLAELREAGMAAVTPRDFLLHPVRGCLFSSLEVYCSTPLSPPCRRIVAHYVYTANSAGAALWSDDDS